MAQKINYGIDAPNVIRNFFIAGTIFYAIPFGQENRHLQVIEDGLPERVDASQKRIRAVPIAGDNSMQHHPLAALTEVIFEFDNQRHCRHPTQKYPMAAL